MVVLWSDHAARSNFIPAEVGAARAASDIALLPVLIGHVLIPPVMLDLMTERVSDDSTLEEVAERLDNAITHHLERRERHRKGMPKIFISHRHKDEDIVRELVHCIKARFAVTRGDIRCTSLAPYRLRVGEDTADRLRSEISTAEVVLGVLSSDTLQSSYVAFELGAAWGQKIWTCPLLVRGQRRRTYQTRSKISHRYRCRSNATAHNCSTI